MDRLDLPSESSGLTFHVLLSPNGYANGHFPHTTSRGSQMFVFRPNCKAYHSKGYNECYGRTLLSNV